MEMVPFLILGLLNPWQNPQSQFAKNELRETAKVPYSATGTRKDKAVFLGRGLPKDRP